MNRRWLVAFLAPMVSVIVGADLLAQGGGTIPSIDELFRRFDANTDGVITKDEVPARAARIVEKWDQDGDLKVTRDEIAEYRKKRGIRTGQAIQSPRQGRSTAPTGPGRDGFLEVPELDEITRLLPGNGRPRGLNSESAFAMEFYSHEVSGDGYCILTDHHDENYLRPLRNLAKHHSGTVIQVKDLTELASDSSVFESIQSQLKDSLPKYVAVAPRLDHFRENTLLACWKLFSTIDHDPELDVFPGFLVAPNLASFERLVDKTTAFEPIGADELRPFFVSQVPSNRELRSLQKSGVLRKLYGESSPAVGIYLPAADNAPQLPGENFWKHEVTQRGVFLEEFSEGAAAEFAGSNFLVLHGHGIPGMSCSVDNSALENAKSVDIVVCGSCFSAAPTQSDFPSMRQAPGGFKVESKGSFVMKAVDSGACVAFGHMRLNSGFAHLYPVLEAWNHGTTIGQSYQQLINGLIKQGRFTEDQLVFDPDGGGSGRQPKQNSLLYVVIGDPALVPFQPKEK